MSLVEQFREDCQLRGISPYNLVLYARKFTEFLKPRGKTPLEADREDMKAYLIDLKTRGLKQNSIDRIFSYISQFYVFMIDEDMAKSNPVVPFRRRYLKKYKSDNGSETRQLINVDQASRLANSVINSRDKAIIMLLLKTGMRRGELCKLDVSDLHLEKMEIVLKPTAKRSNRILFFDHETADVLETWLRARQNLPKTKTALFPSRLSDRMVGHQVNEIVTMHAEHIGLHNPKSLMLEDQFTAHCCRHFFTTHLLRAGMRREYVKWLRGDTIKDAVDTYFHIDPEDVKEQYMTYIPQFGV